MKASEMWISLRLISWERYWVRYRATVVPVCDCFISAFCTCASCPGDQSEILLWEEMVLYHQYRIE